MVYLFYMMILSFLLCISFLVDILPANKAFRKQEDIWFTIGRAIRADFNSMPSFVGHGHYGKRYLLFLFFHRLHDQVDELKVQTYFFIRDPDLLFFFDTEARLDNPSHILYRVF